MHIKKKVAEGHLQKIQDMPPTTRLSQDTTHAPAGKQEKPTQNTKQNHMPIKKKVAEGHLQKIQDTPTTTRLSQGTRHAPATKQETNTEHKAEPYANQKEGCRRPPSKNTRHVPNH